MAWVACPEGESERTFEIRTSGGEDSKFEDVDEGGNGGSERAHQFGCHDFKNPDDDDDGDENDPKDHSEEECDEAEGEEEK